LTNLAQTTCNSSEMQKEIDWWWWCWLIQARTQLGIKGGNGGCHCGVWQIWEWIETNERFRKIYRSGVSVWVWFELRKLAVKHDWHLGGEDRRLIGLSIQWYTSRIQSVGITLPMRWREEKMKGGVSGRSVAGESPAMVYGGAGDGGRRERENTWNDHFVL
jgi:hypothetical protein